MYYLSPYFVNLLNDENTEEVEITLVSQVKYRTTKNLEGLKEQVFTACDGLVLRMAEKRVGSETTNFYEHWISIRDIESIKVKRWEFNEEKFDSLDEIS